MMPGWFRPFLSVAERRSPDRPAFRSARASPKHRPATVPPPPSSACDFRSGRVVVLATDPPPEPIKPFYSVPSRATPPPSFLIFLYCTRRRYLRATGARPFSPRVDWRHHGSSRRRSPRERFRAVRHVLSADPSPADDLRWALPRSPLFLFPKW
ncbi:basic proline-rich protein-like [Iris pallida]|uniref:Basic proline-rich protein-like n=1 Tax=Iris pallida TaxID=29817 RepID=A0AAX6G2G9_IRIPA|nr:basic proline-rich protein-like [Iris pallida]